MEIGEEIPAAHVPKPTEGTWMYFNPGARIGHKEGRLIRSRQVAESWLLILSIIQYVKQDCSSHKF